MRKLTVVFLLAGLLALGGGLLASSPERSGCPHRCCTSPADCPQPACCRK